MSSKKFTTKEIKKLAEMYGCSDSKISYMMNHDLLDISRILFILVDKKAQYNKKKARKMLAMKKK